MKKKEVNAIYINIFIVSFLMLITLIFFIVMVLTKGDLNNPIIIDIDQDLSGISGNIVTVDDKVRDYYYYKGLNYTEPQSSTLPTGVNQNLYPDNRLLEINVTYKANDLNNNLNGYVSLSERQDTYVYHKYLPVNDNNTPSDLTDDYALLELIENPFTDRPTDRGFNGWYTTTLGVKLSYDDNYYIRYAKIPVTYTDELPTTVTITFNASWTFATISEVSGTAWASAFNSLNNKQMISIPVYETTEIPPIISGYYKQLELSRNQSCTGLYDVNGNYQNNCRCNSWWGCTYYDLINNEPYDSTSSYYELIGGTMVYVNPSTFPPSTYVSDYVNGFNPNFNMASYYKGINIPRYSSIEGYYNDSGVIQSGTCNLTAGCDVYELLNYHDSEGNPELVDIDANYYYLATRDTNIIVVSGYTTSAWRSAQNKPFTLTGIHNGVNYNQTWYPGTYVYAYNDTNIENLTIRGVSSRGNTNPTSSTTSSGVFYGAWQNVRIGRGITQYTTTTTNFTVVIGGSNGSTGSSSNRTKYRLIIESGLMNSLSIVNGIVGTGTSNYVEPITIYGNDYDRAIKNDNNLNIYYCASGSWGGVVRGSTITDKIFDLTVKSGSFGTGKLDHTTGIYVGRRYGGSHTGLRTIKVEGGYIYNLIGGPLSTSSMQDINDTHMKITGGSIDMITGGAGTSPTYGNRIIQVTGGQINYSVFGGSNGYDGTSSDGTVIGSSLLYIGGASTIGNQTLVDNNTSLFGAEAGSVFGIGNGRSGQPSIGSSSNSNIIIADHTNINNNVYGGGNFSTVGISSGSSTANTNIYVYGGVIKGSLYGAGNNNGSGNNSVKATVNITTDGGEIRGSLYGGSNALGTVYGDVNINVISGNFLDSIYGGGRGGYVNTSNVGTYIRDKIDITIGTETKIPTITNNIYGGSAYGTVNASTRNPGLSSNGITMLINNVQVGGSVFGGSKGAVGYNPFVAGHIEITVNDGSIPNLFGGNDIAGTMRGNSTIHLNGGTVANVYGGGNQVSGNNTYINLSGSITTNIFGGSNQSGNVNNSTITLNSGTVENVYGGNNVGGQTTNTDITVNGGTLTNVYGGGKLADTGKTTIKLVSGTVPNVYGGGESASVLTDTNIYVNGSTVTNLFGGSNQSGDVPISHLIVNSGNITNMYGGNNAGGKTTTTDILTNGGVITYLYGGGKLANSGQSNVVVNNPTEITNLYGGGEDASIDTSTNLNLNGGTIATVFGGSNHSGDVPVSNITLAGSNTTTIYGGNNEGGTTVSTNITVNSGSATSLYGGGNQADSQSSLITINNASSKITSVYGGGNFASVNSTTIALNGGTLGNVYGGSNASGIVNTSNITTSNNPIIDYIYGGNNAGGNTVNSTITTNGGTINQDIYGGGNQANNTGNTVLSITNTTVANEIYGGGKDGSVSGNSNVFISNSNISKSVYAGGKGATAVVEGNTILNIENQTNIGEHVFGGGNAAATGLESVNNSTSVVNIAGASIGKNVYGGANTSVVYGTVEVNIGDIPTLVNSPITISGTVFGGGEANAAGDEEYDFSFISVTKGIVINIKDTTTNNIKIDGSIFGSGNASSTTGYSYINIHNYGTNTNHKRNISIQRADIVVMDNSVIELFGATDRTNEYSNVLFSFSRVKELKLKNNSTIYLETGTNLLEKFSSLVDIGGVETKAAVAIVDGVTTKNVDNRVYAIEGKNINIAKNEAVTIYGEVTGMSFFGMYMRDRFGNVDEAFYKRNYNHGDAVAPGEFYTFSSGSYVLGMHAVNHNIEVDGFYSNYEQEENTGLIEVKYIIPTPENSNYYMWVIGEAVQSYDVDLIASKFSTLGAYELPLINSPDPNTTFTILGANFNGLEPDIELVDKSEIPRVSIDGTANTKMSLILRSSNTGWITVGETTFLTSGPEPVLGTEEYIGENSPVVPTFLFNLYHSKNLTAAGNVGTVVISLVAIRPIDDLNNEVKRVNINVNITRELYSANEYEGAMTSGEEHNMFVSTQTNITDKSKLSAYYSLYIENNISIYKPGYHRALVSSYVLKENTKITMIDFSTPTPTYYYYIITAADVAEATAEFGIHNEASYRLSKFIKMGSTSSANHFDDAVQNDLYYDATNGIASEEFVFIVDHIDTEFESDQLNNTLIIELRDINSQTMIGVLGISYGNLTYNIYHNKDAQIALSANLSKQNIYVGETTNLNVNTNLIQQVVNGVQIHDTPYYYKKLGLKITMFDENDNQLNSSSLLGVTFKLGNIIYYPRMDGVVRFNIAPKVANVSSRIVIDTKNANLNSGTYKIKIESFGSADGIYFGTVSSDTKILELNVLNSIYGLRSTFGDNYKTIDKTTGLTMNNNNVLLFRLEYASGLANPNLRISLKRRVYDEVYSLDYEAVDLSDYIDNSYTAIGDEEKFEYLIANNPTASFNTYLYLKNNLKTGTYRVTFSLYDEDSYIGEVYNYIIIR